MYIMSDFEFIADFLPQGNVLGFSGGSGGTLRELSNLFSRYYNRQRIVFFEQLFDGVDSSSRTSSHMENPSSTPFHGREAVEKIGLVHISLFVLSEFVPSYECSNPDLCEGLLVYRVNCPGASQSAQKEKLKHRESKPPPQPQLSTHEVYITVKTGQRALVVRVMERGGAFVASGVLNNSPQLETLLSSCARMPPLLTPTKFEVAGAEIWASENVKPIYFLNFETPRRATPSGIRQTFEGFGVDLIYNIKTCGSQRRQLPPKSGPNLQCLLRLVFFQIEPSRSHFEKYLSDT
ncbi:hypothetical protein DFH11DRAFT_1545053 [Phellopilus nigrolimitatus]|nr:hypothetical protein DFH11DRAFT_1545053 [Phellopilus nigrolimitatus]